MTYRNRRPFPARFPGKCLCGASFAAGAPIFWDKAARRATLCPACTAPKAKRGPLLPVGNLLVRVDTHPETGEPVVVAVTTIEEMRGNAEVYRYSPRNGWTLRQGMVLVRALTSEQVEGLLADYRAAKTAA